MRFAKYSAICLLMAGSVWASVPGKRNSSYGSIAPLTDFQTFCLNQNGNVAASCPGAITEQSYIASNDSTLHVFDYQVGNLSEFTLTLTPSSGSFSDFGYFSCDTGPVACGNDPNAVGASVDQNGAAVKFTVPGAGNGLVFYVVETDDGTTQLSPVIGDATVTPEPKSLFLLAIGLMAILGYVAYRRSALAAMRR